MIGRLLICVVLILCSLHAIAEDVLGTADHSVVRIVSKLKDGYAVGSGFVVAKEIVATNFHVIDKTQELFVLRKSADGKELKPVPASILWSSSDYDLALLEVPQLGLPIISVRESFPTKGSQVTTMGYPAVADEAIEMSEIGFAESTFTQGIVGRLLEGSWSKSGHKQSIIQHSASVNSGNSGGPLIDGCGSVIGVNTAKALGVVIQNANADMTVNSSDGIFYASHISSLIKVMQEQGVPYKVSKEDCLAPINGVNPTPKSNNRLMPILVALALLMALGALYFSFRKSTVIRETYTQFQRRSSSSSPSTAASSVPVVPTFSCYLVGQDSQGNPIRIQLQENALRSGVVIGRDPKESDVVIADPSVSRKHARVTYASGRLMIQDLQSTNGTWMNNQRLGSQSATLRKGLSINLGKVNLRIEGDFS
jgi:hypothetical protein